MLLPILVLRFMHGCGNHALSRFILLFVKSISPVGQCVFPHIGSVDLHRWWGVFECDGPRLMICLSVLVLFGLRWGILLPILVLNCTQFLAKTIRAPEKHTNSIKINRSVGQWFPPGWRGLFSLLVCEC